MRGFFKIQATNDMKELNAAIENFGLKYFYVSLLIHL